uniref:Platelet-derived growth factor (PDGF) family profile domain-containing protein n=1 Tax=Glossina brevipalpis TaxID=37001 RepID=A0A1A9WUX0_9MUSC
MKSTRNQTGMIHFQNDYDNIYSRYYVPGSVTRAKQDELGSPSAVLESRRAHAIKQRQHKALASAHHRRIVGEAICRLPQPRVERIRRDPWKIYTPHCTVLHRCADDTGCCPSERQTCAPKRTKAVDLYFFVISLNETQGSIERLTFVNHTECHCVEKSKQRAPEYATDYHQLYGSGLETISNNQFPYMRRATVLNCNCPNLFEKILQEDGYCRCDCSSGNTGCDWLKRGMEHFSMNDRKCILEGRCKLPTCEYGAYIKRHGRCPRREERQLSADVD